MPKKILRVAFLSTWPEITDGISTFCENLAFNLPSSYRNYSVKWSIIKINWLPQKKVICPDKILCEVNYNKASDFERAAYLVNNSNIDLVVIQFINSIYGNEGKTLFDFVDNLKKPSLVILHSIPMLATQSNYLSKQKTLKDLAKRNLDVIVMTKTAQKFLVDELGFKKSKVHHIYHGAPAFKKISLRNRDEKRSELGFSSTDRVIYSYGVLREDKGIEQIVQSISIVRKKISNIKLLITGSDQSGGEYVQKIKKLISNLSLKKAVKFIDRFIPQDEIGEYLQISDLHVIAQENLGLHSSGTLSYALSTGSVIISTPTMHAREILKDAGKIVPSNSPESLAKAITDLLTNRKEYSEKRKASAALGKEILWPKITRKYFKIIRDIIKKNSK